MPASHEVKVVALLPPPWFPAQAWSSADASTVAPPATNGTAAATTSHQATGCSVRRKAAAAATAYSTLAKPGSGIYSGAAG